MPQRIPITVDKFSELVYTMQSKDVSQKKPTANNLRKECPPGLLFKPLKKSEKNFQVPGIFFFIHSLITQLLSERSHPQNINFGNRD